MRKICISDFYESKHMIQVAYIATEQCCVNTNVCTRSTGNRWETLTDIAQWWHK